MPIVEFEDGLKIEFDKEPNQKDIDEAYNQIKGSQSNKSIKPTFYSEVIAPILEGGSTFGLGIPRLTARAQGPGMEEATFPEQQTWMGKGLRGAAETVGFVGGGIGKTALKVGEKFIPKMVLEGLGRKALRAGIEGTTAGVLLPPSKEIINPQERLKTGLGFGILSSALPMAGEGTKSIITKSGRWVSKNIGGITDATVNTIKRLGADKVFDPLKAKADYISQNLAPKIQEKFANFIKTSHDAYSKAINSAPEGKSINIRPAIEKAGNELKQLGLITEKGNLTELGKSEIAKDSVYGKLLDFYQSADAISGVGKLQGKALTQGQMIKAFRAEKETNVNKKQFIFFRDKLNALYKNKPSDIDVSGVRDAFYKSGEDAGMKGLNAAKALENKVFDIEDKVDLNKISRELIKAKNPQWTKVVESEYKDLVKKGIMTDKEYKDIFDDLMAHFANIDFSLVSETPGVSGGFYPSRAGLIRQGIGGISKQYYKNFSPFMKGVQQSTSPLLNRFNKFQAMGLYNAVNSPLPSKNEE